MTHAPMPFKDQNGSHGFSPAIVMLSIVFFIKAVYLAFCVTPLWDIPDEAGHLAYVMQIAAGEGIPVLGTAMIPSDIMSHVHQVESAKAVSNWIAQHPPLYYFVAAGPYWVAQHFMLDVEVLFRFPRFIAAWSGALLLIGLYRTARLVGLGDRAALCLAGRVGEQNALPPDAAGTPLRPGNDT